MYKKLKSLTKKLIPPLLLDIYIKQHKTNNRISTRWIGNFSSWDKAKETCTGYDSDFIINKVRGSLLQVKCGKAVYERDSVLFESIEYSFPLLAGLMWIAAQNDGKLNVLDFGGSLGSTFYQNRVFLNDLKEIKWNIIEQPKIVKIGKSDFENHTLRFFYSIEECLENTTPDVILLSSIVHYLEKPYNFLNDIILKKINFVIFDRTLLNNSNEDKLRIQYAPIYDLKIPCWFLSENKLLLVFKNEYDLVLKFTGFKEGYGFIFKRKKSMG